MASHQFLVISNAVPGKEAEFNEWYNKQHIPDVLKVPGFVAAQRFEVSGDSDLPGRYVAIYEMETDDPQATLQDLMSRNGTPDMVMSDAIDLERVSASLITPITDRVKA